MKASKIFELLLATGLIFLAIYVGLSESLTMPGRVSMNTYYIEPPGTFFIAGSILCFACTLILLTLKQDKYKNASMILFVGSLILLSIGFLSAVI